MDGGDDEDFPIATESAEPGRLTAVMSPTAVSTAVSSASSTAHDDGEELGTPTEVAEQRRSTVTSESTTALRATEMIPVLAGDLVTGYRVEAVRPETLESVPGYQPIDLPGSVSAFDVSPSGEILALAIRGEPVTMVHLTLIDMAEWTRIETPEIVLRGVRSLYFSSDGGSLYWMQPMDMVPSPTGFAIDRDYSVQRYDLDTSRLTTVAQLPPTFAPIELLFNDNVTDELIVFGAPVRDSGFAEGAAQVLFLNSQGDLTTTLTLDGVKAWNQPFDTEDDVGMASSNTEIFELGLEQDPSGRYLYIVHAEDELVTVVDLHDASVAGELDFGRQASAFGWITGWLVPSAKAVSRAVARSVVAADWERNRLFVAHASESLDVTGAEVESTEFSPVEIIDMQSGAVLKRVDVGLVRDLSISPDGSQVLVRVHPHLTPNEPVEGGEESKMYALDLVTGEIQAELELPGQPKWPTTVFRNQIYEAVITPEGSQMIVINAGTLEIRAISSVDASIQRVLVPHEGSW